MEKTGPLRQILGDNREIMRKLFFIVIGNFLCSVAVNVFFIPNGLLSGGMSGIGIILQYLFEIPAGISVFVLNLPIFVLGYMMLDKKFLAYAFMSTFVLSTTLVLTRGLANYIKIDDILLGAVFGAIFNGVGMGLMFKNGTCQGGFDVVAAILKKKFNINIGTGLMAVNTVVISLSSILFGYRRAMYTLIAMFFGYRLLDKVQIGLNIQKNVFIISNKSEEMSEAIMTKLHRGVTLLVGEGAYTNEEKKIIYCTITSREVVKLKDIVNNVDPKAFMTINDVVEVNGRGFKKSEI